MTVRVSGGELFEKIVQKGSYSEADSSKILKQILLGLMEIHSKNIIHRDLKALPLAFTLTITVALTLSPFLPIPPHLSYS